MTFTRVLHLLRSDEFRKTPLRALYRRLRWRLRGRFTRRSLVVPFNGGLRIGLGMTSASSGIYLNGGFSDPLVARLFIDESTGGEVIVDCGAHIGEYTLLFAALVGPSGTVHAFEPDERIFPLLQSNGTRNGLAHVRLNKHALSDGPGTTSYALQADATESSLAPSETRARWVTTVTTTTLDAYVREQGIHKIDAIKINVESAEVMALRGGELLLDRRRRLIFVECDRHENVEEDLRALQRHRHDVSITRDHRHPHVTARTQ